MQPEERSVNDLNDLAQSKWRGIWPPSLLRLVLGALVAVGLGYVVLKTMFPIFVVPLEIATFPEQSPLWMYERLDKAKHEVDGKNYSVVFGLIGAILGASSVVFAFGTKSIRAILIAIVASALLGVVGANLSNWLFNNMRATSGTDAIIMGIALDGMKQSIVGYSLLWGPIGLGVGLGIGSIRGVGKSLVAGISGLCGGVLAAMTFVILMAQFSIGTVMNRVVPDGTVSQVIWLALFPIVIAVCIALGSGEKKPKEAA